MQKLFKCCVLSLCCFIVTNASNASIKSKDSSSYEVEQSKGVCTGVVKDDKGEPIIGASVLVEGTTNGGITDIDGKYSINNVPEGSTIKFSYLGFQPKNIKWNGGALNVTLVEDSQELGAVVVTALGIKKDAKKLGYAVSTVKADDLTVTGSSSLGSALYGKAAGVRIQTAPGGTGAISVNVRGLSSITGTNMPLVVVDGVPIRNSDANNSDYWGSQYVESNGLADINPEDIESLSILKGASASALYGSEAANGVVMITTKSGRGATGFGVDFNASLTADFVAYMPQYQDKYGPGVPSNYLSPGSGYNIDGFQSWTARNGQTYTRATRTTNYWGPQYDGRDVLYYDGTVRKYSAINKDPWSEVFRTGFTQQYNLGITSGNDKGSMRFSYTFLDNVPNQYNSTFNKHNFNLTGNYNISQKIKFGYGVNYIIQDIKNRPYRITRLTNNFGGMFGTFDDVKYLREHTQTSLGYMNSAWNNPNNVSPDEGFEWDPAVSGLVSEYFWKIQANERLDTQNRLVASVTPSWEIIDGLTLAGRFATDFETQKRESKNRVSIPISIDPNQGYYSLMNNRYQTIYGDLLLTFDRSLTDKIGLTLTAGWQARKENYSMSTVSTKDGLSVENWFNLNASNSTPVGTMGESEFLKTAALGIASFSYASWAYLEATVRQEKISTLAPGNNSFFYPSVNGSIIFTELFRDRLPSWYEYGKIRASYGIVGNAPSIYAANQAYTQNTTSGKWTYNLNPYDVGNGKIKPEKKHEFEIGLESKFLNNRLGFEFSYYSNTIKDQILKTTMPITSGANSILLNVGELSNKGWELSVYGVPVVTKDWTVELRANVSGNSNKVNKLQEGIDRLEHANWDNGSAFLYSFVGRPMGDIYSYKPAVDDQGRNIITKEGFYKLTDEPVKIGNAMPKVTGGFATSVKYKDFGLDMSFDFRVGGMVFNNPYQYMMSRGGLKETLKYHDGEGYGKTFYFDSSMNVIPYNAPRGNNGPNGERVFDNGIILDGILEDGTPNTKMIPADQYINSTYGWGGFSPSGTTYYANSFFDNSFVKLRELAVSYTLPKSLTSKFNCRNLQVSVYGRNLFYVYKNMPVFDAEATDGTSWTSQAAIGGSTATTRSFGFSLRASF